MKNILLTLFLGIFIVGCDNTPSIKYSNYNGEPIKIDEGIYFRKIVIQDVSALLQCDENGKILNNQNTPISYQVGKTRANATTLTLKENSTNLKDNKSFNFSCDEIEDCYNKILIVKNSMSK